MKMVITQGKNLRLLAEPWPAMLWVRFHIPSTSISTMFCQVPGISFILETANTAIRIMIMSTRMVVSRPFVNHFGPCSSSASAANSTWGGGGIEERHHAQDEQHNGADGRIAKASVLGECLENILEQNLPSC